MNTLENKLTRLKEEIPNRNVKIMIMGLGSVGMYLLDYLMSLGDQAMEIYVVGRNEQKMMSDVNIIRVASLIRCQNHTDIKIISDVDFDVVPSICKCLITVKPDIVINSSRVYSGLKYGSISWNHVRAYGIWAPLAVKYMKNIMQAYEEAECQALVINTSYSDAVIPWLKSAGKPYPDFGSGNINHLIPRIQFAAAGQIGIPDYWNIEVTYATSHFHDVVISKEGQVEGVEQLISIQYHGEDQKVDFDKMFEQCKIAMPVDGKRNMMNASSNFQIIQGILSVVRDNKRVRLHCPGVFGEIGGYPVILDGTGSAVRAFIDEEKFGISTMREKNRDSIYLDGIEHIRDGILYYTDELIAKVREAFGVELMKAVHLEDSEEVARFLISKIIERFKG